MLRDEDADRSVRLARAQGLKVLGQLFCNAAEVAKLKQAGQVGIAPPYGPPGCISRLQEQPLHEQGTRYTIRPTHLDSS